MPLVSPAFRALNTSFGAISKMFFPGGFRELFGMNRVGGADFMSEIDKRSVLNRRNEGLLIDGQHARLNLDESFRHVAVISPTGGGKTTRYILPNLLTLQNCSMVVTDPSGELFEQTSGYLASQGFNVKVINPTDPYQSFGYNPLSKIRNPLESSELAHLLVQSLVGGNSNGNDTFWNEGAESLLDLIIQCLKRTGKSEWATLHNVLYCLQNFGEQGRGLDAFVEQYASDSVYNQFTGLIQAPEKTLGSWVSPRRH